MNYFLIPSKLDNVNLYEKNKDTLIPNKIKSFLVSGELITLNEAKKMNITKFLNKYADKVSINKNDTYYFFGARKYNKDTKISYNWI